MLDEGGIIARPAAEGSGKGGGCEMGGGDRAEGGRGFRLMEGE